ncbi:MAG: hypothetical protein HQK60_11180 [Deltaproteobacteria bacterium]|nr:hypothetical protein [Deltaproteobacteria bacterium]
MTNCSSTFDFLIPSSEVFSSKCRVTSRDSKKAQHLSFYIRFQKGIRTSLFIRIWVFHNGILFSIRSYLGAQAIKDTRVML